jgi:hypothetical protein
MNSKQESMFNHLKHLQSEGRDKWVSYWLEYSSYDTWQFWLLIALFLIPLVVIYFFIDRERPLLLGFYGYNVHVFFTYLDALGTTEGYWGYPYKFIPLLPSSFALDVSLVPAAYMFLYQWVLKKKKNYYIYMILLSAFFAFIFKPLLVYLHLFVFFKEANYLHFFWGYLAVGVISKLVTNVFIYLGKKSKGNKR